jgi:hypothetical protein
MPNWCNNTVTISHEDPAMIERVRKAFNEGRLLDEFIPVPQELRDTVSGHCGDGYAQELNQFKMELNLKYFGAKDWYDFCVSNWGTKWDVGADGQEAIDNDNNTLSLNFESAWAPPVTAYEKLMEQGFKIIAYYYEPGMAFCGKWDDGADDYYEYGGMSSEEVAATIPDDLDECFCISEDIAMWEEENKEEEDENQ